MAAKAQRIELTEEFIGLWRQEKSLWDAASPLYRNKDAKERSLFKLGQHFSMSGKYQTLFKYLHCESKNETIARGGGGGGGGGGWGCGCIGLNARETSPVKNRMVRNSLTGRQSPFEK